ncbi:MAG: hypothetical protein EOM70_10650, partial [Clostridia bacterium]|nr:hypothetical protein [Clostridia bacterium]
GTWTKSPVIFNLGTGSGNTPFGGTARYELSTDDGSSWQAITAAGSPAVGSESGPDGSLTGATYTVSDDLVQTVRFRTVSNSGVASAATDRVTIQLDNTAPAPADVTIDNGSGVEVTPDQDTWYKDNTLTVRVSQDSNGAPVAGQYSIDGGTTWLPLTLTENVGTIELAEGLNTLRIQTSDEAGNYDQLTGVEWKVQTELTNPVIFVTSDKQSDTWTNQAVSFALNGTSTAPINVYQYSTDGTTWQEITETPTGDTNQVIFTTPASETAGTNYQFRARSIVGHFSSPSTMYLVKIDRTNPIVDPNIQYQYVNNDIVSKVLYTLTSGLYFGTKIQVTVTASDAASTVVNSGLLTLSYTLTGTSPQTLTANPAGQFIFQIDPPYTGGLTVQVSDQAANVSETISITENFTLDATMPGAAQVIESPTLAEGKYSQGPITYTLTNASTQNVAGVKEYQYQVNGSWYNQTQTINNVTYTLSQEGTPVSGAILVVSLNSPSARTGSIQFRAISLAKTGDSNDSTAYLPGTPTASKTFRLDQVVPVITSVSGGGDTWQQSATLTVEPGIEPESGATYWYRTDSQMTWQKLTNNDLTIQVASYFDGTYSFKAISGSGVESSVKSVQVRVSPDQPSRPVLKHNGQIIATGSTIGWTNETVELTAGDSAVAGFSSGTQGIATYQLSTDSGASWKTYEANSSITINGNTNQTYHFRSISVSGLASSEALVTVKYWNTIQTPQVSVTGTPTNGTWYKASPSVNLTAANREDDGPPVTNQYVLTTNSSPGQPQILSESPLTLVKWPDGRYELQLVATDEAGNESSTGPVPFNVDTTAPVIQAAFKLDDQTHDEQVIYRGLDQVRLEVVEANVAAGNPVLTIVKNGIDQTAPVFERTGEVSIADYEPTGDGSYQVTVSCTDLAGNTQSMTRSFILDSTPPQIQSIQWRYHDQPQTALQDLLGGEVFDRAIDLVVSTAETNPDQLSFDLIADPVDGTIGSNPAQTTVDSSSATLIIQPPFKGTVSIKAVDDAQNQSMQAKAFIIDKDQPSTPVISAAGGYASGMWTQEDVTLAIMGASALSGIARYEFSTNDGDSWSTYVDPISISSNTDRTYLARAVSYANNISQISAPFTVKVLKTLGQPTLSVIGGTLQNGWYPATAQVLAVNSQTFGAEITSLQYRLDTEATWTPLPETGFVPVSNGQHDYQVRALALAASAKPVYSDDSILTAAIESELPVLTVTMKSEGEPYAGFPLWAGDSVVFEIESTATSGVAAYYLNDQPVSLDNKAYTVETSGTYVWKVLSTAGNFSEIVTQAVQIDKNQPSLSVAYQTTDGQSATGTLVSERLWFGQDLQLAVSAASLGTSPIDSVAYQIGNGLEAGNTGTLPTSGGVITLPATIQETVKITATTKAGRQTTFTTPTLGVDQTAPSFSVQQTPEGWINGQVALTILASDAGSGLPDAGAYRFGTADWTALISQSYGVNGPYLISVRDAVGNMSQQTITISTIDTTAPTVSVSTGSYRVGTWSREAVSLIASASDEGGSGIPDALAYSFDDGQTWQNSPEKIYATELDDTVRVKVKDRAGNISQSAEVSVKIDLTGPVIEAVSIDPESWTKDSAQVRITSSDSTGTPLQYSFDNGQTWQDQNTRTYSADTGANGLAVRVQAKDAAGNVTIAADSQEVLVKIDQTAPQITAINYQLVNDDGVSGILKALTSGLFFRQKIQVSITSSDDHPGTLAWSIGGDPVSDSVTSGSTTQNSISFDLSPQFQGTVTATATDLAGNQTTAIRSNVTLDAEAPARPAIWVNGQATLLDASGQVTPNPAWTHLDVAVSADGGSALSGIASYQARYVKDDVEQNDWTSYVPATTLTATGNGSHTLEFRAISNAGNEGQTTKVVLNLLQSISAPNLVASDSPGANGWYKAVTTLAATNTQDFGSHLITLQYFDEAAQTWSDAGTGGSIPVINGEHTYRIRSVAFPIENGTDHAVKSSETSVTLKIEKELPVLTVTTDPVYNSGSWTNASGISFT